MKISNSNINQVRFVSNNHSKDLVFSTIEEEKIFIYNIKTNHKQFFSIYVDSFAILETLNTYYIVIKSKNLIYVYDTNTKRYFKRWKIDFNTDKMIYAELNTIYLTIGCIIEVRKLIEGL